LPSEEKYISTKSYLYDETKVAVRLPIPPGSYGIIDTKQQPQQD